MDNHDFSNIGQQIKSMVQDAINTMDFKKLNQDIGSTVNSALNELREGIKSAGQGQGRKPSARKEPPAKAAPPPPVARSQAYINPKPSGSVSGVFVHRVRRHRTRTCGDRSGGIRHCGSCQQ